MSQNSNYFHFLYATFAISLLLTLSHTIIVQIKKCDFFPSHFLAGIIKKREKNLMFVFVYWLEIYT